MKFKSEDDFQKKCRICGRFGRRFADIFTPQMSESKPNKKLPQLIYRCLQLQVSIVLSDSWVKYLLQAEFLTDYKYFAYLEYRIHFVIYGEVICT